jgi:serine/threonine-protein phosphatase PGAM5
MAKRRLYLVRHGQYVATPAVAEEPPDGRLTETGQRQSLLTAHHLKEYPITVIHHSTLQRATETASIIATLFPTALLQSSDLLCECIPSVPSAYGEIFEQIPAGFISRGGPQARQAFDTYFTPLPGSEQEDQHEIIVSSGNLICYFVCRVLRAPDDSWMQTDIQNCGVTEIIVGPPRGFLLLRHNESGHLPSELRTW